MLTAVKDIINKKRTRIAVIVLAVLLIAVAGAVIALSAGRNQGVNNPDLSKDGIILCLTGGGYINTKMNGVVRQIDAVEIRYLLATEDWIPTSRWSSKNGDAVNKLIIRLAEEYELCFYSDGLLHVYYGYAGMWQDKDAYYSVSSSLYNSLFQVISEKGTLSSENVQFALD